MAPPASRATIHGAPRGASACPPHDRSSASRRQPAARRRRRLLRRLAFTGIGLLDRSGCFRELNPALLRLLERRPDEVVGRPVADFVPPAWTERAQSFLASDTQGLWRAEFPVLAASGREVLLEWNLTAQLEPGLNLAVVRDVTERAALARQREALLEREQAARAAAERLNRSKDEFIAVLSHELRTPLNAMLGWMHMLRRQEVPPPLQRGLDVIERNARMQARLIADLLDVSRIDLGKLSLDLQSIDPREIVDAVVTSVSIASQDKRLRIVTQLDGAPARMVADPARLQQILMNLLTNAIKFSHEGGEIAVRLGSSGDRARLSVRDHGQGIRADFLPYLFDRFSQGDLPSNRRHGGLGLGLAIVKQVAELHGGSVRVESEGLGHGACFVVELPIAQTPTPTPTPAPVSSGASAASSSAPSATAGASPASFTSPSATPPSAAAPELDGVQVLVVEDDEASRQMLTTILRDRGAKVLAARDYDAAWTALEAARPQLLVCDIGLPVRDGYQLMHDWRAAERGGPRLPAIALTAFSRPQDQDAAFAAGFDAHCTKPRQPTDLIATMLQLLSRQPSACGEPVAR